MSNQDQNTENNPPVELSIKSDDKGARVIVDGVAIEIISTVCALMEQDEALRTIIMMSAMTFSEVSALTKHLRTIIKMNFGTKKYYHDEYNRF